MRSIVALTGVALATLLVSCGPIAPAAVSEPTAAAEAPADQVALAMEAYGATMAAPGNGAALRQALDQVELAMALAPAERRAELVAAEGDLVTRIGVLAASGPASTPSAEASTPEVAAPGPTPVSAPAAPRPAPAQPSAPPTARASGPAYALATRKSFEGSGNSGQFASCVDVQILGRGGPVGGAVIGINNGDHSYQDQTDPNGYAGRCGLGASTWSVVLFWTPQGGQAQGAATTVYVSGAPEQRAAAVFQER